MQLYMITEISLLLYVVSLPQKQSVAARIPLWAFTDFRNLVTPRCQDQFAGVHNQNPPKPCK